MTLFGWAGLAGTTFAAALLQAVSRFGFAMLAVPLYLLLVAPAQAVQLAIILATALSIRRGSGTAAYHRSGAVATINSRLEWTRWLSASLRFQLFGTRRSLGNGGRREVCRHTRFGSIP